jgi:hypothetical protein
VATVEGFIHLRGGSIEADLELRIDWQIEGQLEAHDPVSWNRALLVR